MQQKKIFGPKDILMATAHIAKCLNVLSQINMKKYRWLTIKGQVSKDCSQQVHYKHAQDRYIGNGLHASFGGAVKETLKMYIVLISLASLLAQMENI